MRSYREQKNEPKAFNYQDIPRKLSFEYAHSGLDPNRRLLDDLLRLCEHLMNADMDTDKFLQDAVNLIQKHFALADVSIGLKDSVDGLYRYRAMTEGRDSAASWKKSVAYKREEFSGADPYKGYDISRYTRLYLTEDKPWAEGEEMAYNRPALMMLKRRSPTHFLEGDFFDIHMFDRADDLIGWIEISGTRLGEFPDVTTVKWIELIGRIISSAISLRERRLAADRT